MSATGTYYNENDPGAAAWLRELMKAGLIPTGDVDERSIADVQGSDLASYVQCHFFAGIGGWALALCLAGWGDARPVWTGSCPCPPFSAAGKKKACPECQGRDLLPHPYRTGVFACCDCGHEWPADARHLWPEFHRLVADRRPPVVFGEQVAGADGLVWLAGVRATLEILGYGVGAADLCAAGVASPHIRQRLYWVADADGGGRDSTGERGRLDQVHRSAAVERSEAPQPSPHGGMGNAESGRNGQAPLGRSDHESAAERRQRGAGGSGSPRGLALANGGKSGDREIQPGGEHRQQQADGGVGFWSDFDLIPCRDDKARRVESGTFPLAHGVPERVGLLRGYGNAIVPQVAAEFIRAFEEAREIA